MEKIKAAALEELLTDARCAYAVLKNGEMIAVSCDATGTSVALPSTLKQINNEAFEGCENLTRITLPDGLEDIGNSAFLENRALTKLFIPLSVQTIGDWAFSACYELTLYYPGEHIPSGWKISEWGDKIVLGAMQN